MKANDRYDKWIEQQKSNERASTMRTRKHLVFYDRERKKICIWFVDVNDDRWYWAHKKPDQIWSVSHSNLRQLYQKKTYTEMYSIRVERITVWPVCGRIVANWNRNVQCTSSFNFSDGRTIEIHVSQYRTWSKLFISTNQTNDKCKEISPPCLHNQTVSSFSVFFKNDKRILLLMPIESLMFKFWTLIYVV